MPGTIGGMASRFVADDSLAIRKMHRVGHAIATSNPVYSSLQNNCAVFVVELETQKLFKVWVVPDLDLLELSLWLADFKRGPIVA